MASLLRFDSLHLPSTRIPPKHQWPASATEVRLMLGQPILWCPYRSFGTSTGNDKGHHLSSDQLDPYRLVGDPSLDDLLERLEKEGMPLRARDDFLDVLLQQSQEHAKNGLSSSLSKDLSKFYRYYCTLPSWVDVEQLKRGQDVFLTYSPAIGASLFYRSLVAGFSIPKIAAVIQSTGYLAPPSSADQVSSRLMDTGALIGACMTQGVESLLPPHGQGFVAALRVRVLHAKVRRALLKRQGSRKWSVDKYGIPINQEDMAGTLLAFTTNAIVGVEFLAGWELSRQEQLDYTALWRYIGWLLGVHTVKETNSNEPRPLDPCGPGWGYDGEDENISDDKSGDPILHSRAMLQSIICHLMKPDDSSIAVAHHLLKIGKPTSKDKSHRPGVTYGKDAQAEHEKNNWWFHFRSLQCRRYIGNPLADKLCLPLAETRLERIGTWLASTLYLSLIRIYTLAAMWGGGRFKCWIRNYHAKHLTTFHKFWQERYPKRMAEEFQRRRGNIKAADETSSLAQESTGGDSCCPFAMVAPPQY